MYSTTAFRDWVISILLVPEIIFPYYAPAMIVIHLSVCSWEMVDWRARGEG
ncbi:hypothetical protein K438DRAFT_1955013 [Mycena galopus ATCC 62051]|nr:hypothetical protein K438DRAFT_1955013 [Mycena galopus ATCC 62051]